MKYLKVFSGLFFLSLLVSFNLFKLVDSPSENSYLLVRVGAVKVKQLAVARYPNFLSPCVRGRVLEFKEDQVVLSSDLDRKKLTFSKDLIVGREIFKMKKWF